MRLKKIHPLTGEELEPIYRTKRGALVWPQMGASPDDPGAGDGDDGEDDDADDDEGTGGTDDDGDGDGGAGKGETVTREEFEAVMRRMRAADKRASALEAEKKKAEDAKKDELTKATERVAELEKQNAELVSRIREGDLRDAFGQVEGVAFKKPATALRIARADGYLDEVMDDDGNVDQKALAKKVNEFAKAYPELLRDKGDSGDAGSNGSTTPTGTPAGSTQRKPGKVDDKAIKQRYGHLLR